MRNTGRTTEQLKTAPLNAVYVWCNSKLEYPRRLAKTLHRDDIELVGPSYILSTAWRGRGDLRIGLDHALRLDDSEMECVNEMRAHVITT